jgi:PAS domain S-box-containing protein
MKEAMLDRALTQGLLDNESIGVVVSDCQGRCIEVNRAFASMIGYEQADLTNMTVGDFCCNNDLERELYERDQTVLRKRFRSRSGKMVWGDTTTTPVRDATGSCLALVTLVVDVTDQRRQQLIQQGQSQVLAKLYRNDPLEEICKTIVETIESVEEGLLCSILQLNPATGTLHKLAAPHLPDFYNKAIEGMEIGDGVGSCGTAAFRKHRVIVTDILTHPYWARARRLIEKTSLRSCWSQPFFDKDGSVLGTFAIYYNEPREPGRFELELINSAAELTALAICHEKALAVLMKNDQLKSEFISTAAHELRTPLSSIMGFTDLILDQNNVYAFSVEQKQSFLNEIIENATRLNKIIDDILDVRRIESGRNLSLNIESVSLSALLTKIVNRYRLMTTHQFNIEIGPEFPERILVDAHRISQVLENLLSNAVKYSPKQSRIDILAERSDCACKVQVTDQGIGMSREQASRIFEKFYRADTSDTAVHGLGLGMSIVKQIISDHGGSIRVESSPGKGSTIHFSLPINGPPQSRHDSAGGNPSGTIDYRI